MVLGVQMQLTSFFHNEIFAFAARKSFLLNRNVALNAFNLEPPWFTCIMLKTRNKNGSPVIPLNNFRSYGSKYLSFLQKSLYLKYPKMLIF